MKISRWVTKILVTGALLLALPAISVWAGEDEDGESSTVTQPANCSNGCTELTDVTLKCGPCPWYKLNDFCQCLPGTTQQTRYGTCISGGQSKKGSGKVKIDYNGTGGEAEGSGSSDSNVKDSCTGL